MVIAAKYVVFQNHVFVPWRYIYDECRVLRGPHPQAWPLMCLQTQCPANANCMEVVAKRVFYWFDFVEPKAKAMYAYFKHGDSIGLGFFTRAMFSKNKPVVQSLTTSEYYEPTVRYPVNVSAFDRFMREGTVKDAMLGAEYVNIASVYKAQNLLLPIVQ